MTTPPTHPNESDHEHLQLESDIRRALSESNVEFRESARRSAVAAALQTVDTVETEPQAPSTQPGRQRWMLVAASIVVVCVGLVGAFIASSNGDSDQLAVTADSAVGPAMGEEHSSAEMAPEMADRAGDGGEGQRDATTDDSFGAAQDFDTDSVDIPVSSTDGGLESVDSSILDTPIPSTRLVALLKDRGLGVFDSAMNGASIIDLGEHEAIEMLLAELEQLEEQLHSNSVNIVDIDGPSSNCIYNYISTELPLLNTLIGYTVIDNTINAVAVIVSLEGQRFAVTPLQSCGL